LHKISTLIDILTRGGSKGVCVVLATQDRGQIEEIYGPNLTDAIFNSCNSWAALRCKDPATARIIVDRVGEWRFQRQEESISDKIDDGGDSISISKRTHREKLLLDSDIMGQEKLQAYIHIDGCDFSHVEIERKFFQSRCPAFVPRADAELPDVQPKKHTEDITESFSANYDVEVGV
jgi:type IV secretory pathway TraG/TraD family ATPase VirD4